MNFQHYYLELNSQTIRFDSVSQLTNVFFDDSNKQVFAVRSGGTTGIVVKGPTANEQISFCMDDKGTIRSIKFSPDNTILAIQRTETCVEFHTYNSTSQPNLTELSVYRSRTSTIFGFVWVHSREVAIISNAGVELFVVNKEKKQLKSSKSTCITINWFAWSPPHNLAVFASNNGSTLTPVLLRQGTITRLPKLDWDSGERGIPERDLTLGQLYGVLAVLILKPTHNRLVEVIIYLLNGPGLAPRKSHILCLGHNGRFAMNIIDDLVVVHHQATKTSLLFDIALNGELDQATGIKTHSPIMPGKPLKPFALKIPSLSLDGQTINCELYSANWVIFQPDIVIDAKLGCLWYVQLNLEALCTLITDKILLVELLLQRTNGKQILFDVLQNLLSPSEYKGTMLPVIGTIFDKINVIYEKFVATELQSQTAQPSAIKPTTKMQQNAVPRVLIDQSDMCTNIFQTLVDSADYVGKILMLYLNSLAKHNIVAQHDLSKMIIIELIRTNKLESLRSLVTYSLINESKPLACFLLSMSSVDSSITQIALDMLHKLKANNIIIEVLLGQGKIIEALRLAKTMPDADQIMARKYLESAMKSNNQTIFYSVYTFFQQRNIRLRGSPDFLKSELCDEYIEYYNNLYENSVTS